MIMKIFRSIYGILFNLASWLFCCWCCSFLTILLFCYSTMMAGWVSGMNLSGPSELSILVSGNKLNGEFHLCSSVLFAVQLLNLKWSSANFFVCAHNSRWYAKRFLHPDIVAAYEYIFIWDEDLGVEHFNAEEYAFILPTSFQYYSTLNLLRIMMMLGLQVHQTC